MSSHINELGSSTYRDTAKQFAKRALQAHIPVGPFSRAVFSALYHLHVATRTSVLWSARFFWFEPLFRSQCRTIGKRFRMEQLPYLVGCGDIEIGDDVQISGKPSLVFSSRLGSRPTLSIGNGSFLGHNCALIVARRIEIGSHCLIASGVRISDYDGHPINARQRSQGEFVSSDRVLPVKVGDGVWIGSGATILKGVTIGDRTIVGTRAVVTHSLPPDCIAAGNPARVIKSLATPSSIEDY